MVRHEARSTCCHTCLSFSMGYPQPMPPDFGCLAMSLHREIRRSVSGAVRGTSSRLGGLLGGRLGGRLSGRLSGRP